MSATTKLKRVTIPNDRAVEINGGSNITLMDTEASGARNLRADFAMRAVLFEDREGTHIVPFENVKLMTPEPQKQKKEA